MRFNPLDYPSIFMQPDFLNDTSAWTEHIPFGFLLMDLARPRVVVELGTHSGVSYCAMCQAVAKLELPARCYAIDTWKGDAHTGEYSEKLLKLLRDYHNPLYGGFSELIRSTFDDALGRFADGSIDVLHIDGLHTLEAVTHDYENWNGKLSDRGIVLFHDTAATEEGFGVYKLWAELEKQFPSFEFKHGFGLGVLGVGANLPLKMLEFFEDARNNPEVVRGLFSRLGNRCLMLCAFNFLIKQQRLINQWRRHIGAEVNAMSESAQAAMANPVNYATCVTAEVLALANDDLRLREQSKPESKP
jgi:hypothetical protein